MLKKIQKLLRETYFMIYLIIINICILYSKYVVRNLVFFQKNEQIKYKCILDIDNVERLGIH